MCRAFVPSVRFSGADGAAAASVLSCPAPTTCGTCKVRMSDEANPFKLALNISDSDEARMRHALGLREGPIQERASPRMQPDRRARRFVRDGEVPVVVVNGARDHGSEAPAVGSRLAAAETAAAAERTARERAERALAEALSTVQQLRTQMAHASSPIKRHCGRSAPRERRPRQPCATPALRAIRPKRGWPRRSPPGRRRPAPRLKGPNPPPPALAMPARAAQRSHRPRSRSRSSGGCHPIARVSASADPASSAPLGRAVRFRSRPRYRYNVPRAIRREEPA